MDKNIHFKTLVFFLLVLGILSGNSALGQVDGGYPGNVAKINLLGLPLRNFSVQYERLIARKTSLGLGVAVLPRGSFPMLNSFESLIDDEETFRQLQDIRVGSTSVTLEPRIYFGKQDGARGFYIAPYVRYNTYALDFDQFDYEVTLDGWTYDRWIPLEGNVHSFTGGVMFGAQWRIARHVYLDWWMVGAAYGVASGSLKGTTALTAEEQYGLGYALNELEIPMVETTVEVDAGGARLGLKGPWAGVRTGLSIGVAF